MKRIIIVLVIVAVGAGLVIWLLGDSQEFENRAPQVERFLDDGSRYVDPSGFSFEKPSEYTIRTIADDGGKTLLFEKTGVLGTGFQMFISFYDEPVSEFTTARVKKDLPDIAMKNVREFEIAGGRGVMFDLDMDREMWFVVAESLYQLSVPMSEISSADRILTTFKVE